MNKDADQPAHPLSVLAIRYLDSIIPTVAISWSWLQELGKLVWVLPGWTSRKTSCHEVALMTSTGAVGFRACSKRVLGLRCFPTHTRQLVIQMSLVTRKPVFGVCDQVRHKPICADKEAWWRLEISDIETGGITLSGSEQQRRWSYCADAQADLQLVVRIWKKQVLSWYG